MYLDHPHHPVDAPLERRLLPAPQRQRHRVHAAAPRRVVLERARGPLEERGQDAGEALPGARHDAAEALVGGEGGEQGVALRHAEEGGEEGLG